MTVRQSAVFSFILIGTLALAQTFVLDFISIAGVSPDLVLLLLIFVAQKQGSMRGQLTGLVGGLIEDLTSLSPPGFHALLRLTIGFVAGLTHNKVFLDPVFVPIILIAGATLMKWPLAALIAGVFSVDAASAAPFTSRFFIELGYNAVLAPPVFAILSAVGPQSQRGSRL